MNGYHAVVLAAGSGARFGGGKLTAPLRGRALVDHALDAALEASVETVILVTGANAEAVAKRAEDRGRVRTIHAADHDEGMAASLRAGIAALPQDARGVLIFLGDMPDTPRDLAPALLAALESGAAAAIPRFQGRRGHPAALSARLFPELLRLTGDRGARDILAGLGEGLVEIETSDPGVLVDVDTRADLERLG